MAFDIRLVPLILALGMDTLALSTALGVVPLPARTRLRLALTFAAAEGLMPAVGLLIGRPLGNAIGGWAVYIASALLLGTGIWLLFEGLQDDDAAEPGCEVGVIIHAAYNRILPSAVRPQMGPIGACIP